MDDWWVYSIIFLIGGFVTFLEEASRDSKSVFNRKVLKFLPVKHIFSAVAVVFCIISFIIYCFDKSYRITALVLCFIGIAFLAVVIIIDLYIILKKAKK